jgi:hypothetical protein
VPPTVFFPLELNVPPTVFFPLELNVPPTVFFPLELNLSFICLWPSRLLFPPLVARELEQRPTFLFPSQFFRCARY